MPSYGPSTVSIWDREHIFLGEPRAFTEEGNSEFMLENEWTFLRYEGERGTSSREIHVCTGVDHQRALWTVLQFFSLTEHFPTLQPLYRLDPGLPLPGTFPPNHLSPPSHSKSYLISLSKWKRAPTTFSSVSQYQF